MSTILVDTVYSYFQCYLLSRYVCSHTHSHAARSGLAGITAMGVQNVATHPDSGRKWYLSKIDGIQGYTLMLVSSLLTQDSHTLQLLCNFMASLVGQDWLPRTYLLQIRTGIEGATPLCCYPLAISCKFWPTGIGESTNVDRLYMYIPIQDWRIVKTGKFNGIQSNLERHCIAIIATLKE